MTEQIINEVILSCGDLKRVGQCSRQLIYLDWSEPAAFSFKTIFHLKSQANQRTAIVDVLTS